MESNPTQESAPVLPQHGGQTPKEQVRLDEALAPLSPVSPGDERPVLALADAGAIIGLSGQRGGEGADMFLLEDAIKLLMAVVIGGLIGAEREFRGKAAGLRTIIFICLGATFFTMASIELGGAEDPVRIASNIVVGVGFLGAGSILQGEGRIVGLTTAATIWLAAALGMGIGGGYYGPVLIATVVGLLVLLAFPRIEVWMDRLSDMRTYEIILPINTELARELEAMIHESGLKLRQTNRSKSAVEQVCRWQVSGSFAAQEVFTDKLLSHPEVKRFSVWK
jgi:putative Mg2+ transporter-C (MgtC) family protein